MTNQEIFTKVATHLLKQNACSLNIEGLGCMYRGNNGAMCAVGCLISDAHYKYELEFRAVRAFRVQRALKRSGIPTGKSDVLDLLVALQFVHDRYPTKTWRDELGKIAKLNNLEMPEVPK